MQLELRDTATDGARLLLSGREAVDQRGNVSLSPEHLPAIAQVRHVLDRLTTDGMLSAAARLEASVLRAAYPSDAELVSAAMAGNELSNWIGVFLRCRRMMDVLVLFEQGAESSQRSMAAALCKFPDWAMCFASGGFHADSQCPPDGAPSIGASE